MLFGLLGLPLLLLVSCSGQISGHIYIDENNNGLLDFDEPAASSVKVTITKDGKKFASGYTLPDGTFGVKGERGTFCVMVDKRSYSIAAKGGAQKDVGLHKQAATGEAATGLGTTTSGSSTETTSAADTTTAGSSGSSTTSQTTSGAATSGGTTTTAPSALSGNSSQSSEKLPENCKVWEIGRGITFEVGIKPDYLADVSVLERVELAMAPAEQRDVTISYPCGCDAKCFFPEVLEAQPQAANTTPESQPDIGVFEFQSSVSRDADADANQLLSGVCVEKVRVKVKEDLPSKDISTSIKCKAICPDGEKDLPSIPVKIAAGVNVELMQQMFNTPRLGGTLNVDVVVKNKNGVRVDGLRLTIAFPEEITVDSFPQENCEVTGDLIRCRPAFEVGEREKIFSIRYRMPATVRERLTLKVKATLDGTKIERAVEDTISFTLSPPA